jgi:hypothetical protein
MSSNICFDLIVSYEYNLRGTRPHVEINEDNEIEMNQQALNQLCNNNNTNTQNNQNNQNIQNNFNKRNNFIFDSENSDKMEIDFFY